MAGVKCIVPQQAVSPLRPAWRHSMLGGCKLRYKDVAEAVQNTQKKDATNIGFAHAIPPQQGEAP
jgi:hypothetical protein